MDEHKRVVHALNRLTFGPSPGDIERVSAIGLDKWIDQQLHPEKIDDNAMDARLAQFPTLQMSTEQIVENFPPPEIIRAIANGKASMPSDPVQHAIYEAQLERFQEKQERKQQVVPASANTNAENNMADATDRAGPHR